jgi:hypothetical protein
MLNVGLMRFGVIITGTFVSQSISGNVEKG